MEPAIHCYPDLFAQLGLPNRPQEIRRFIAAHSPLAPALRLPDAPFWTPAQARFLREALEQDADWSVLADRLSEALRGPKRVH